MRSRLSLGATVATASATYAYDGSGMRVQKTVGAAVTTYVYDAFGNLAAEYSNQPATASPCGTLTCYVTVDHLGSTRLLTDSAGSTSTVKRYDYLPFGEELLSGVNGRSTAQGYLAAPDALFEKFTGQVRDGETANPNSQAGLDFFNARYFSGAQGRFQSVDPANAGASPLFPQTWNAYAYVGNNPMTYTDPSGESWLKWLGLGLAAGASFFAGPVAPVLLGITVNAATTTATILGIGAAAAGAGNFTPGINALINANNQGAWNERVPTGVSGTGGVFGGGNTNGNKNPYIFSFDPNDPSNRVCGDFFCDVLGRNLAPLPARRMDVSDPAANFTIAVTVTSTALAAGAVARDIRMVEKGVWFGTRLGGNQPLLNSNTTLRIGWSYIRSTDKYVFRIGGTMVGAVKQNPHINLWPPSWWFK